MKSLTEAMIQTQGRLIITASRWFPKTGTPGLSLDDHIGPHAVENAVEAARSEDWNGTLGAMTYDVTIVLHPDGTYTLHDLRHEKLAGA